MPPLRVLGLTEPPQKMGEESPAAGLLLLPPDVPAAFLFLGKRFHLVLLIVIVDFDIQSSAQPVHTLPRKPKVGSTISANTVM